MSGSEARRGPLAVAVLAVGSCLLWGVTAEATLSPVLEIEGQVNWSLDGAGEGEPPLMVAVPPGSTVLQAFLYSSVGGHTEPPAGATPVVVLDGVTYDEDDFTPLEFVRFPPPFATGMQAFRADATAQIASLVDSGSATPLSVPIDHELYARPGTGRVTGTLLAVVYTNPAETERRIVLADGGSDPGGDEFSLEPGAPRTGREALLSLGIHFSSGRGPQKIEVEINGRRLTSVAGGDDDTRELLTVGGLGDSAQNPSDPFDFSPSATALDDELYDLSLGNTVDPAPYLTAGTASVTVSTFNASNDDNLFFAGLNVVQEEVATLEVPSLSRAGRLALALLLAVSALGIVGRLR